LTPSATADASSSTSRNVNKIIVLTLETVENIDVVDVSLRNVSVRKSGDVTYDLDL